MPSPRTGVSATRLLRLPPAFLACTLLSIICALTGAGIAAGQGDTAQPNATSGFNTWNGPSANHHRHAAADASPKPSLRGGVRSLAQTSAWLGPKLLPSSPPSGGDEGRPAACTPSTAASSLAAKIAGNPAPAPRSALPACAGITGWARVLERYMAHWDVVNIVAGGPEVAQEAAVVQHLARCAAPMVLNEYGVGQGAGANCSAADGWFRWVDARKSCPNHSALIVQQANTGCP